MTRPGITHALARADATWALSYGTGSRRELRERLDRLQDAERAEREHQATYAAGALAAEFADECAREAARTSDAALVAYERKWAKRLAKLQRAYPGRWRVPGLSAEELQSELTLRLIDAVRTKPDELAKHQRAGREWGLAYLTQQRRAIRDGFRLEVVLEDPSPAPDCCPNEEERLVTAESRALLDLARERAEGSLTRPQRRWLSALKLTANAGQFFESSGKLNLAAASRVLSKNRSSAQRAFGELQQHFGQELRKLDW